MAKITALIPAFNESQHIFHTVSSLKKLPSISQIVVVDDASFDGTADLAASAGAEVLRLKRNLGKGGALNQGLKLLDGDIIALLDGDLGNSAVEVSKLIEPVLTGEADMTIARFPASGCKGGFGLAKGLARSGLKLLTKQDFLAPLSGQRVLTRQVLEVITPFAPGFGVEVGMTIDILRRGFRVKEVETLMTHAETGRDLPGFYHRGKQFYWIMRILAQRSIQR